MQENDTEPEGIERMRWKSVRAELQRRGLDIPSFKEAKENAEQVVGCYRCDYPYEKWCGDLNISDELWNEISPKPDGGGLLCPNCIMAELSEKIGPESDISATLHVT